MIPWHISDQLRIYILYNTTMKELYVLGAGASCADPLTKLPLGKELCWNYNLNCGSAIDGGASRQKSIMFEKEKFDRWYHKFFGIIRKYWAYAEEYVDELNKYERLTKDGITYFCYKIVGDNKKTDSKGHKKPYIEEVIRRAKLKDDMKAVRFLKEFIAQHVLEMSYLNLGQRNSHYNRLAVTLKQRPPDDTTVVSFNFDYSLEESILLDSTFKYIVPESMRSSSEFNGIPLIKPHGSLNWSTCPICKSTTIDHPTRVSGTYYHNRPCYDHGCPGILEPLIIAPNEDKELYDNFFYERIKRELQGLDVLTIIGYSFPDYDSTVKDYLVDHVDSSTTIQIVDTSTVTIEKIKGLFQNNRAKVFSGGFKQYIESLT